MVSRDTRFSVKRSSAGLGLFTNVPIQKGERVIEYTGELITDAEADRRGGQYLFAINGKWTVDGKGRDNIARYLNHSCRPNCESRTRGKQVFIYARKKIQPGDELTYDYGREFFNEYIKPKGCRCAKCAVS